MSPNTVVISPYTWKRFCTSSTHCAADETLAPCCLINCSFVLPLPYGIPEIPHTRLSEINYACVAKH